MFLGLEVDDDDDVEELVQDHHTELTTKELPDLQKEQHWGAFFRGWEGKGGNSYFTNHPDNEVANCAIIFFNDNTVFHFMQMLKCRQKQTSLGRFQVRYRPSYPEASSSRAKRPKEWRKKKKQDSYLMFLWNIFYRRELPF